MLCYAIAIAEESSSDRENSAVSLVSLECT